MTGKKGWISSMQDKRLIELHSHLLPQMDDGSDSVEMSLAMLNCEAEQNVGTVCVTPHYYADQNSIATFCERRSAALEKLLAALPEGLPRIIPAAEVAFFSGISECEGLGKLCIENTRTLLLEMPFGVWNDFQVEEVSALVLDRGYEVVLVHPERFCTSRGNRRKLNQLTELPVGMQVNVGTLLHWRNRRLGLELLQQARIPLLASDCHNLDLRRPNLKEGRAVVARWLGEAFLEEIDRNAEQLTSIFEVHISG